MITGSRVLATDVGDAFRGWLVFVAEGSQSPVVLTLEDQPYRGAATRQRSHTALNDSGSTLHERLNTLEPAQLTAVVQQSEANRTGEELVERVLRYWARPRLGGVDWWLVGPSRPLTKVRTWLQEHDYDLAIGDPVMLAGDGFADVHGTVEEVLEDSWMVQVHWNEWDR